METSAVTVTGLHVTHVQPWDDMLLNMVPLQLAASGNHRVQGGFIADALRCGMHVSVEVAIADLG